MDYQHIYSTQDEGDILGCTLFSEQLLSIFDKENMCKSHIHYYPIAVVLDKSLVEGNRRIQENITGLHEGGHIWLHSSFYSEMDGQLVFNDMKNHRICCRKGDMEAIELQKCSSAEMWREWQATTFAVTLGLPKKSLDISVPQVFRKYGIQENVLVIDDDYRTYELFYHLIPEELSRIYNMSKEAIRYRLEKTGFYTTRKKYDEAHAQLSLFDYI